MSKKEKVKADVLTGHVYKTEDLAKFSLFPENRVINESHTAFLTHRISERNLLHMHPILVNSRFQVWEGQHRLKYCEAHKEPIYYHIVEKPEGMTERSFIIYLNSGSRSWSGTDFINTYADAPDGYPDYKVLKDFMALYSLTRTQCSVAITALSGTKQGLSKDVKEGKFRVRDLNKAYETLKLMRIIHLVCDRNYLMSQLFCSAIYKLFCLQGFDPDRLISKLSRVRTSLVQCARVQVYLEILVDMYNKGISNSPKAISVRQVEDAYREIRTIQVTNRFILDSSLREVKDSTLRDAGVPRN